MARPPLATPPILALYTGLAAAFAPFATTLLRWRARRGKEDTARRAERLGHGARSRPPGRLMWLHAASVGELVSVLPLIDGVLARGLSVLVTTGTLTSARVAVDRLPKGALHAFAPLDVPRFVGRFLDHWRPNLAVFVESELWPATVLSVHRAGIPLSLINARLSARSARRWSRVPGVIAALLGRFDLCLAQSADDAERLRALGAREVVSTGNLKIDAEPPPADPASLASLRSRIGTRPVLLAASTHRGEEAVVAAAQARLQTTIPDLLTIIVPRHPDRGEEIAAGLGSGGIARRSRGEEPGPATTIYVADTLGEIGIMLRLADLVFLGGSLVPRGGHNPVEPIKLGVPLLHGPRTENFAEAYAVLDRAGGACQVSDGESLAREAARLLADANLRAGMAHAAETALQGLSGALERTLAALEPYLDSSESR